MFLVNTGQQGEMCSVFLPCLRHICPSVATLRTLEIQIQGSSWVLGGVSWGYCLTMLRTSLALVVGVAIGAGVPRAQAAVSGPALSALEALYNATNGPQWVSGTGSPWLSGPDPCTWVGVLCNAGVSPDPM